MKAHFPKCGSPGPILGALVQAFALLGLVLGEPGYATAAAQSATARATPPEVGPTTTAIENHSEGEPFTSEQLETLVGPVALYPDELLAIVLPASTYPLQIVQAARFLEKYAADDSLQPDEGWDESVLGLLNYPEVIELMNNDLNWTWQFGEAAANQQEGVMDSVQRFRAKARSAGNLVTNEQMVVKEEEQEGEQVVVIESSSTEVIYVPVYQPSTVVVYHGYPYPWYWSRPYPYYYHRRAAFWTGMWVGAAVGYGCRWGRSGYSSVTINRNVNINVNRPGSGNRPGGGDRPSNRPQTRPSQAGAQDWKADANRGKQSGGRPGNAATRPASGTRPSQAGTRDRAGTSPARGGTAERAATRPSDRTGSPAASDRARSSDRSGAAARPSSADERSRNRSGSSASRDQSRRNGSFGNYQSRSASQQQRARGASSRGGASRGGGGHRGGGGRRR